MIIRLVLLSLVVLGPCLAGCRASYPTSSMKQTIARICEDEYGVKVEVKEVGNTIGALIVVKNMLLSDLSLSDQVLKKIEDVMLTVSRVTLSSEERYEFFVIAILDPDTGIQVSFVRYIKDIRRLITDDISRNDYFQRLLIETEIRQPWQSGSPPPYNLKEYKLEGFLARQISERIQLQLQLNLVSRRIFQIEGIDGGYYPAEENRARFKDSGVFRLTVRFHPEALPFKSVGTPEIRKNFTHMLRRMARTVIKRYGFTAFEGMEIVDGAGERLAYFDRQAFNRESMNTLMELIRSIKKK
ncbi:hypothetical protein KAR10_00400 [bacterium]|nr:hypothetical protein [bacterium]